MAAKRAGLGCRQKFGNAESASSGCPEAPGTSRGNQIEAFLGLTKHAGLTLPTLTQGRLISCMVLTTVHNSQFLYAVLLRTVSPYTQFYGFFPSLMTEVI